MRVIEGSCPNLLAEAGLYRYGDEGEKPVDELDLKPETKAMLKEAVFVHHLPFVRTVIFIATPHGGSYQASQTVVGLFSRLSSFAAAGFLLLTVLTQPSLPWIPAPPNSEGNYLVINKNVIEMVALLVLMTTRSGRWFGLDAIVSWLFGRRRDNEF